MARYRRSRRSYSRGRIGGGIKSMLPGILAGIGDSIIDPISPVDGVAATGIGIFMHSPTIRDIGLYKVGFSLGNILPIPKLGGGGSMGGGLL